MFQPDLFVNILVYGYDQFFLEGISHSEFERGRAKALEHIEFLQGYLMTLDVPFAINMDVSMVLQSYIWQSPNYSVVRPNVDSLWEVCIVTSRTDFQYFPDEFFINNIIARNIPGSPQISHIELNHDVKLLGSYSDAPLSSFKVLIWDKYVPLKQCVSSERVTLLKAYRDLFPIEFCKDFRVIAQACSRERERNADSCLLSPQFWDDYPLILVIHDRAASSDNKPENNCDQICMQIAQAICDIVSDQWHPLNDFVPEVYYRDERGFFTFVSPSRDVLRCDYEYSYV